MKFSDFIKKYTGVAIKWRTGFGGQCVDLARQYFHEVWGMTEQPEGVQGAGDFANHNARPIQRRLMSWTPMTPGALPPVGSVLVMKPWPQNRWGHIGVCYSANAEIIELFDQDGFKPTEGAKITRWRNDSRFAGWLLPA